MSGPGFLHGLPFAPAGFLLDRALVLKRGQGTRRRGFGTIRPRARFTGAFPDEAIVAALRRPLTRTHPGILSCPDDPAKRDFCTGRFRMARNLRAAAAARG